MSNESFLLLAIGVFLSLIVGVAAIDQFLIEEHPPSEVSGLIWRVGNALSRVRDLEAVVEVTESLDSPTPIRMLVRFLNQPIPALSMRYLDPPHLQGQVFTVQNDQLWHYVPGTQSPLIVVKRWVGFPLAAVGLAGLDLTQIQQDWENGLLDVDIVQSLSGFTTDAIPDTPISVRISLTNDAPALADSLCPQLSAPETVSFLSFAGELEASNAIRGEYILEVRDTTTGDLARIVWIDRETFYVHKVVFFVDGERGKTIQLQRIDVDQGLTPADVLTLPPGVEIIRG